MTLVDVYTDASVWFAVKGKPSGWAAVLIWGQHIKEVSGPLRKAHSSNKAELMAVSNALKEIEKPCEITIHSDSKYVVDGINQDSINLNQDLGLWEEIDNLRRHHIKLRANWVKGHSGVLWNEVADRLAKKRMRKESSRKRSGKKWSYYKITNRYLLGKNKDGVDQCSWRRGDAYEGNYEPGVIHLSHDQYTASHSCFCGCGEESITVMEREQVINDNGTISFPFVVKNKCGAQYFIQNNEVLWCHPIQEEGKS